VEVRPADRGRGDADVRVDEVPENVFAVPSRINSTWGGNLTDMVRSRRQLKVIAADGTRKGRVR